MPKNSQENASKRAGQGLGNGRLMVCEITVYIIESGAGQGPQKGWIVLVKESVNLRWGALCQGELSEGLETRVGSTFWVRCLVSTP